MEYSVISNLNTLNQGNAPNFVVRNRNGVIVLTLGTNKIGNLVSTWYVSDDPYLSDYRYICFRIGNIATTRLTSGIAREPIRSHIKTI
jgi:hypothetical protein